MTLKIKAKQIKRLLVGGIVLGNVSFSTGDTSKDITNALTTALTSAGDWGVSVPLQVSNDINTQWVVTDKKVVVLDTKTKNDLVISGQRVYWVLSESGGTYTVDLKYLDNDWNEQTATLEADQDLDLVTEYRFEFDKLPNDFATSLRFKAVEADSNGGGTRILEVASVTATNTDTFYIMLLLAGSFRGRSCLVEYPSVLYSCIYFVQATFCIGS